MWLDGVHAIQDLTKRGVEMSHFSANDWYATYERHGGHLEMVLTELNLVDVPVSHANMSYLKMMNQYFIKYCSGQKKLACLFEAHELINDNIRTAADAIVILQASYLKYLGHVSRGFVL